MGTAELIWPMEKLRFQPTFALIGVLIQDGLRRHYLPISVERGEKEQERNLIIICESLWYLLLVSAAEVAKQMERFSGFKPHIHDSSY